MNRRNGTRSLLLPIAGIVVISMILTISLYWIVINVFAATAEPIEQNIPITTETTTIIQTTVTETTTVQTATETTAIIQTTVTETTTVQTEKEETTEVTTTTTEEATSEIELIESESILTRDLGLIEGPSGNETWYNLNMDGVIKIMYEAGYEEYQYWIREDGVKMFGQYVMCAADLELHPRGTLVETSLGMGIVCDTGTFTYEDPYRIDIAVTW